MIEAGGKPRKRRWPGSKDGFLSLQINFLAMEEYGSIREDLSLGVK